MKGVTTRRCGGLSRHVLQGEYRFLPHLPSSFAFNQASKKGNHIRETGVHYRKDSQRKQPLTPHRVPVSEWAWLAPSSTDCRHLPSRNPHRTRRGSPKNQTVDHAEENKPGHSGRPMYIQSELLLIVGRRRSLLANKHASSGDRVPAEAIGHHYFRPAAL